METQHQNQMVHSDGGGEYSSRQFITFCETHGIRKTHSPPYTPEYNGEAERLNRTIVEKMRSLLLSTGLPHSL